MSSYSLLLSLFVMVLVVCLTSAQFGSEIEDEIIYYPSSLKRADNFPSLRGLRGKRFSKGLRGKRAGFGRTPMPRDFNNVVF